jgi:tetratricopeptide (TPR) repeat protein
MLRARPELFRRLHHSDADECQDAAKAEERNPEKWQGSKNKPKQDGMKETSSASENDLANSSTKIDVLKNLASQADKESFDSVAVQLYERILRIEPLNDAIWWRISECLFAIGRLSESQAALERVRKAPAKWAGHLALLQARLADSLCTSSLAEEKYREAVRLSPHTTVTWTFLARYLALHGRTKEAIEILTAAIASDARGDLNEVHYCKAELLKNLGQFESAKLEYEIALSICGDYPEAQSGLREISFWERNSATLEP